MTESQYQGKLIKKIQKLLPGCVILKNDPSWVQGIPDILILFLNKWAVLEVKFEEDSRRRPNQEYYIGLLDEMSFASFIAPHNEEDVLYALQESFGLIG